MGLWRKFSTQKGSVQAAIITSVAGLLAVVASNVIAGGIVKTDLAETSAPVATSADGPVPGRSRDGWEIA